MNKGDLPLYIHWALNGENITSGESIRIMRSGKRISILSVDSVQAAHKGNYLCIASNAAGKSEHSAHLYVNGTYYRISP